MRTLKEKLIKAGMKVEKSTAQTENTAYAIVQELYTAVGEDKKALALLQKLETVLTSASKADRDIHDKIFKFAEALDSVTNAVDAGQILGY
jgi:hypothetical protein